jgi:hypothetical protein
MVVVQKLKFLNDFIIKKAKVILRRCRKEIDKVYLRDGNPRSLFSKLPNRKARMLFSILSRRMI